MFDKHDPLLFGQNDQQGLVAIEHVEKRGAADEMALFVRRSDETIRESEAFHPFIITDRDSFSGCPVEHEEAELQGDGPLDMHVSFVKWKDCLKARDWLSKKTGAAPSAPGAPFLFINDPVQQHLMSSGRTLFKGLEFGGLKRMQVDIECITGEGYEFCNAERESDRIIAIGLGDQGGWLKILSGADTDEKTMLQEFVRLVRERDPDVIEGHNIFNFDLPYIAERARQHGIKLELGRDGSAPKVRPSRFSAAERTIGYERRDIFGRHVVDTLFLTHFYDISHRSLDGFGLKEVAVHFGLASPDRTYIEGSKIGEEFRRNPDKVMKYLGDDVAETRDLSNILSRSNFVQAQLLPYSYQNICVRGNATKIDALMIREYMRREHALPKPDQIRDFEGGYTDMFVEGVVQNVHHCDIRSLYPTLMLSRKIAPRNDELGVFLKLLGILRDFRLQAKDAMRKSAKKAEKTHLDAIQATFKVLINSFYGYLGFSQARFSDFTAAESVTSQGRELLRSMIKWLSDHGAKPVEIDTDGIYFVPPEAAAKKGGEALEKFRSAFEKWLPAGIEMEFDGEYKSMYSYKMKNYAVLSEDGEIVIKGAALKSRGLEPFQRSFLREIIRMKLEGRDREIPAFKVKYEKAIRDREWKIEMLAKTENLQDSPSTYSAKIGGDKRNRSAVYELALRSGRDYRAGDQLSYYVTGDKKSVAVYENAKLASEWDPGKRDENVPYYLAKLDALYEKFGKPQEGGNQAELDL
jgi:DNA polymerase elongation subunit (family B)